MGSLHSLDKPQKRPTGAARSGQLGRVAAKLFLAICDDWELSNEQRLVLAGQSSRTTLAKWRDKVEQGEAIKLSPDTLERLSYIAGIYKALELLFEDRERIRQWPKAANHDFGGQSALERMLCGRIIDLADVRRYLDGWRGALYA